MTRQQRVVRVTIGGYVQGVGYRAWMAKEARESGAPSMIAAAKLVPERGMPVMIRSGMRPEHAVSQGYRQFPEAGSPETSRICCD